MRRLAQTGIRFISAQSAARARFSKAISKACLLPGHARAVSLGMARAAARFHAPHDTARLLLENTLGLKAGPIRPKELRA
jgi:hypothetical protein